MVPTKFRRFGAVVLAFAFLLAACTGGADQAAQRAEALTTAANNLVNALNSGDFSAAPAAVEPAANPQAAVAETLTPLLEATGQEHPTVTLGDVTEAEPTADNNNDTPRTATATLNWSWPFGGDAVWTYQTQAHLQYLDDPATEGNDQLTWKVDYTPNMLVPDLALGDTISVHSTKPARADILDGAGQPLVTMRPVNRLGIDKSAVYGADDRTTYTEEELEQFARQLVELVAASGYTYDPEAFVARVHASGPRAFVDLITLREGDTSVDLDAALAIPSVSVVSGNLPLAPTSTFARAILGRSGEATAELIEESDGRLHAGDITGLSGLQRDYDEELSGTPGIVVTATSADGTERDLFTQEALAGDPLETTFDVALQERAEAILADVEPASAIVAIRPSTGEILAAASGPGSKGADTALLGSFAPGSTFKVVDALAATRQGITADTIVSCPPEIVVDGHTFTNVPGYPENALGDVPLRTAFAHSCNTAMIGLGDQISQEQLANAAQDLGFEVITPIGTEAFYGEVPVDVDATGHAAAMIGQGQVLASPFTMARVAASIAAGHRVDPFLLRSQASDTGASNLTPEEATAVQALMNAVVTEGSADMLADIPGIVGAKTGTAQFGDGSQQHAWMIAITDPSAATGDLAVAVFVDEGDRGSTTAGPLMRAFLTGE